MSNDMIGLGLSKGSTNQNNKQKSADSEFRS